MAVDLEPISPELAVGLGLLTYLVVAGAIIAGLCVLAHRAELSEDVDQDGADRKGDS